MPDGHIHFKWDIPYQKALEAGKSLRQWVLDEKMDIDLALTTRHWFEMDEFVAAQGTPTNTDQLSAPGLPPPISPPESTTPSSPSLHTTSPPPLSTTPSPQTNQNTTQPPVKRGKGRPLGSKNRPKDQPPPEKIPKKRGRPLGVKNKPKSTTTPLSPKVSKVQKPKSPKTIKPALPPTSISPEYAGNMQASFQPAMTPYNPTLDYTSEFDDILRSSPPPQTIPTGMKYLQIDPQLLGISSSTMPNEPMPFGDPASMAPMPNTFQPPPPTAPMPPSSPPMPAPFLTTYQPAEEIFPGYVYPDPDLEAACNKYRMGIGNFMSQILE